MKIVATFSERLKEIMRIRAVRAHEIVEATGISKSNISGYINGKRCEPKRDKIYLLAHFFRVNEMWLMGYDCSMEVFDTTENELKDQLHYLINDMNVEQLKKTKNFIEDYIITK